MRIEIEQPSKLKETARKIKSKSEDILFTLIEKVPDGLIPLFIMSWLSHYLDNQISKLNQQVVQERWKTVELEQLYRDIKEWEPDTK